jgi:hypothetical protein
MIARTILCLAGLLTAYNVASATTRAPVPGAVDPAVTQATVRQTVCRLGYTFTVRPPREWSHEIKARYLAEQHLPGRVQDYELDHLIPLNLGGAPQDIRNVWMQRWDEAKVKDDEELALYYAVCAGRMTLDEARRQILDRWGPKP